MHMDVYGQTYGDYQSFHKGNHNEIGNPHPQYSFPILNIGQASSNGQYTKLLSTDPISSTYKCHFFLKAELVSYSEIGTNTGYLYVHATGKSDGTIKTEISFSNETYQDIFSVYKRVVGSSFVLELYLKSTAINDQLKFIPILCDLSIHKDWAAYQNKYIQRSRVTFYENQPYVSSIPDTLLGASSATKISDKNIIASTINVTSGTTIDCTNLGTAILNFSSPSTIIALNNYRESQIITIHSSSGNATIENNSTIKLKGGVNVTPPIGGNLTLRRISSLWAEISRNF
ncbi:hypothetical protein [Bacillus sp. BP-3]|uniref:hypothetical protein n=1 Tax=Bacillus sp. BP-3 TaxID=3022773 RepID=UPI00232FE2A4|nr:hypothetical protein [Bacillus sp. BP-3]MDC2867555.1 hypothetical protein [Bacillus sp. BP-3]